MKAIHNMPNLTNYNTCTVFNISKIQNESNSQHDSTFFIRQITVFNISKIQNESNSQRKKLIGSIPCNCVQYFKDTK